MEEVQDLRARDTAKNNYAVRSARLAMSDESLMASEPTTWDALKTHSVSEDLPPEIRNILEMRLSYSEESQGLQQVCHCGNIFMPDARYCRKCGSKRPPKEEAQEEEEFSFQASLG